MDMNRMLGQGDGYDAESQQEERGNNPLLVVHLLLQGRYTLAVILAVVLGAAAGVLGFRFTKQTWSCTGMVQIKPVISMGMFGKDGTMPMYEQFVATQVVVLKGERCMDMAMASPRWLDNGNPSRITAGVPEDFKKKLEVMNAGEIIRVTYTDANAKTAQDAVAAIIDAYQSLQTDNDPDQTFRKEAKLQELKKRYEEELGKSRARVLELANPYTPDALQNRYNYKQMEANQAETEKRLSKGAYENWKLTHPADALRLDAAILHATQIVEAKGDDPSTALAPAPIEATAPATKPVVATQPVIYTPEQIGQYSLEMRTYLDMRRNAQLGLDDFRIKFPNIGENNSQIVGFKRQIAFYDDKIADIKAHWTPPINGTPTIGATTVVADPLEIGRLMYAKMNLDEKNWKSSSDEVTTLGKTVGQINDVQANQLQTVAWLAETKQTLEELHVQANQSGRILVLSQGDRPELKDKRIPMAAAAGFGGGLLGFGIVVVWGLFDRRLRTIDQARMSLKQGMRVLGMLPSLPKNLEDPAAASFAALCVHHIRMLLQVMPRLDGHPAIAVTSPSPGDGKTSLTMALALSFAASGKSTLLIDCDIVGAGLTRRVNAIIRRRIGQILIRENMLTPAELREALSAAQRTGRKLGEVLVDEGFLDAEQLSKALKQQGETSVGLLDVMRGEVLEDCVAETGTPRLWILPVGSALAEHGATISPEGFRSVLDQARKRFDVILVDTGPVPGAIESSVAASQVDGVVLTVSRGEQGPLVKRAAEHLRDIGGRVLGLVFNRATPEDFSSSYGSMSSPSIPERARDKTVQDMSALGPVAAAVAGHQKSLREGKD